SEATQQAALALAPSVVANTLGEYMRAWVVRVRGGDSGVLPVVVALIAIGIVFQAQNSLFLSAGNLTNLLVQGAPFMLFGMAEVFVLLLGEIDLSLGFVGGIAGAIATELVVFPRDWPWAAGVVVALLAATAIGVLQGSIITRLGVPSFVVTLAGLLFWQGMMISIIGEGGTIP